LITDTNVSLSRWPFRRLPGDEPADLVARLRKRDVTEAWVGSFDALLHKDIAGVNARLTEDCRRYGAGLLVAFGTVNVSLPDWKEDLRRCADVHRMPGIRVYPNYHGYQLTDPAFGELLALAASRGLIVQLVAAMEDERTQNPLLRVPDVQLGPAPDLLRKTPKLHLQIVNSNRLPAESIAKLIEAGDSYFDLARVEGVHGLEGLVQQAPERVVFGSHSPFFYFESALLKLKEAGLNEEQRRRVLSANAARLRGREAR
jgi:predicted TIM-barrel fold metal-dependent hydrolase